MNGDGYQDLSFVLDEKPITVRARPHGALMRLDIGDDTVTAESDGSALRLDGVLHRMRVVRHGDALVVIRAGRNHVVRVLDPLAPPAATSAADGRLSAPIPSRVVRVEVAAGDTVAKGQRLVVLEAMKMELTLAAPRDGVIAAIRCAEGEMVQEGTDLVVFEPAA